MSKKWSIYRTWGCKDESWNDGNKRNMLENVDDLLKWQKSEQQKNWSFIRMGWRSTRLSQVLLGHQAFLVSFCSRFCTFWPKWLSMQYKEIGPQRRTRSRRNLDVDREILRWNSFSVLFPWLRYDSKWCIFFTWCAINRQVSSTIILKWGLVTENVYFRKQFVKSKYLKVWMIYWNGKSTRKRIGLIFNSNVDVHK